LRQSTLKTEEQNFKAHDKLLKSSNGKFSTTRFPIIENSSSKKFPSTYSARFTKKGTKKTTPASLYSINSPTTTTTTATTTTTTTTSITLTKAAGSFGTTETTSVTVSATVAGITFAATTVQVTTKSNEENSFGLVEIVSTSLSVIMVALGILALACHSYSRNQLLRGFFSNVPVRQPNANFDADNSDNSRTNNAIPLQAYASNEQNLEKMGKIVFHVCNK
jgi:hypothetical protein